MKKTVTTSVFGSKLGALAFLLAMLFSFSACDKQDDVQPEADLLSASEDMLTVLQRTDLMKGNAPAHAKAHKNQDRKPTFNTLLVALAKTGLTSTVAKNDLTLFAPSDEAFAKLGLYPNNIGSVPNLREILLYHAVAGKVYSTDLTAGYVPTLNGAALNISLNGGVQVNDANVILADARALNGVIHVVDKVLMPPTLNLVELALSFDPEFSILVAAVQRAGLGETLASGGPYTVFAPTNDAFIAALGELGFASLEDVPVEALRQILLYHVVEGRVYSSDLRSGEVSTANGDAFVVNTSNLTLTDTQGRVANLVPSLLNVQATNGVVHVIDKVILPNLGS
ncbi:fasciclin domain-containing protein [Pontibacter ramchanderi]|uniref:Transforming growth factor-beta-induced protein n=1 Tax=Pontibacter ramchanderi TaxID=1179743 RepID=A0A2N3U8K2_9BACT|nr:fasciclin domain-containing protein [Pontibacter ramchanderi]PKV63081.1 transforming growth factor-beta-induced protein [Pontibacter ramchanderi]